jgi:hypothetical protein
MGVEMRKDSLYVCGSLALFAWIAMTYFLFMHRPNSSTGDLRRSRLEAIQVSDGESKPFSADGLMPK